MTRHNFAYPVCMCGSRHYRIRRPRRKSGCSRCGETNTTKYRQCGECRRVARLKWKLVS